MKKIRGFTRGSIIGVGLMVPYYHACPIAEERETKHVELREHVPMNPVGKLTVIAGSTSSSSTVALTGVSAVGFVGLAAPRQST
jgi:hypothetical protein